MQEIERTKIRTVAWRERAAVGATALAFKGLAKDPVAAVHDVLPAIVLEDASVQSTATRLARTATELQARLEAAEVQNIERAELARRQTERYRKHWKGVLQDRDRAHDQLMMLRERWFQGFDTIDCGRHVEAVPLEALARKITAHRVLKEEFLDALRVGRDQCRLLGAELDDRQARLHENLITVDTERESRISEIAVLRKTAQTVSTEQGRFMTELDVARRRVAGVEADLQHVTEQLASARVRTTKLRTERASASTHLQAILALMHTKEADITEQHDRLLEAEATIQHTNAMIQVAEHDCEALGLKLGSVHDELHGAITGVDGLRSPSGVGGHDGISAESEMRERISEMQTQVDVMHGDYGEAQEALALADLEVDSAASCLAILLEQVGYPIAGGVVDGGVTVVLDSLPDALHAKEALLRTTLADLTTNVELHKRAHGT
jgi:chromosome segregation ATPase